MEITWNETGGAKEMIEVYLANPNCLRTTSGAILQSFSINRQDLQQLLNSNAEEGVFMLAVSSDTLNNSPEDQQFTLVMTGSQSIAGTLKIVTQPVFNKFKPCPSVCIPYEIPGDAPLGIKMP